MTTAEGAGTLTHRRKSPIGHALLLATVLSAADRTAAGTLTYGATTFNERWQNDGVITTTVTLTLTGDTFAGTNGQNLVASGWAVPSNVPSGLTGVATRTATNKVVLALTGAADSHTADSNISDLGFAFQDAAFAVGPASSITGASRADLQVAFRAQNPAHLYVATNGSDTAGNGSIGSPYATVSKAISMAQSAANDVIHLLPGTYTQNNISAGDKVVTITGNTSQDTVLQANAEPFTAANKYILKFNGSGMVKNLTLRHGNCSGSDASGAAVRVGSEFFFDSCLFATNATTGYGGAVQNGNNSGANVVLSFLNCQLVGNRATLNGGAIRTYTRSIAVSNCTFVGNSSGDSGGAISRDDGTVGSIRVHSSSFIANSATNNGGAINLKYGNGELWDSTLATNVAGAKGGGYHNARASSHERVVNSTITANSAGTVGGGIYFWSNNGKTLTLANSTVYGNTAGTTGGGVYLDIGISYGPFYHLYSSIVAGNTASTSSPDLHRAQGDAGTITNSLVGNKSGAGGFASLAVSLTTPNAYGNLCGDATTQANPGLLPLADNGGQVPTCALQADSVALDRGANTLGLPWDARGTGYARAYNTLPDIGAFEFGSRVSAPGTLFTIR